MSLNHSDATISTICGLYKFKSLSGKNLDPEQTDNALYNPLIFHEVVFVKKAFCWLVSQS